MIRLKFFLFLFLLRLRLRLEVVIVGVRLIGLAVVGAVSLTCTEEITDTSFIVIACADVVGSLISCRFASCGTGPVLDPVAWHVTSTSIGEVADLLAACEAILRWHTKELEPLEVVLSSARCFTILGALPALNAAVDYVDCCSKGCSDSTINVSLVWLKEARHDVVHAWLGVLWAHVEPDSRCHGEEAVLVDQVWVL